MIKQIKKMITGLVVAVAVSLSGFLFNTNYVMADGFGLTVTPMNQKIVINPGEVYEGAFKISNPAASTIATKYDLSIEPFYMGNNRDVVYEAEGDMASIVDWVKVDGAMEGKLEPNEVRNISFKITVPRDAPAGGQYFAIIAKSESADKKENDSDNEGGDKAVIEEIHRVAHLVYAEVTGATVRKGEITEANLSSFLLSGKITGSSTVENKGNVHGTATYKMQVFPLFSNEEVFTNVEHPDTMTVLPNRSVYEELSWDETPTFGIFNVVYSVDFEGSTAEIKRMVIICPVWLMFIIIFVIVMLIIYIVLRVKKRGTRKKTQSADSEA